VEGWVVGCSVSQRTALSALLGGRTTADLELLNMIGLSACGSTAG
jgi:hypothetical protein